MRSLHRPSKTCSSSCASKLTHTKEAREKRRATSLERFGTESPLQSPEVKAKIEESLRGTAGRFGTEASKAAMKAKLGVDNASQLESVKDKKRKKSIERFGVDNPAKSEEVKKKIKATNEVKYGGNSPFSSDEVKEKARKTNLDRYGDEFPIRLPEFKEKARRTSQIKYGTDHPQSSSEVRAKVEATNLERHGVRHSFQAIEAREKAAKTNLERYGASNPFASEEIKEKIKATLLEKYGVEYISQRESHGDAVRATSLKKYGVTHPMLHPPIRDAFEAKMLETYGVRRPLQVPEFREKAQETFLKNLEEGNHSGGGRISKLNLKWKKRIEESLLTEVVLEGRLGTINTDFFIPKYDFYVELNPTITHNSEIAYRCVTNRCGGSCEDHFPLSENYHFERARIAKNEGKRLYQFFQWEINEDIIKFLKGKTVSGVKKSARSLNLLPIGQAESNSFLRIAHPQGPTRNQSHCYGLFNDGALLAVATFGKARFGAKEQYEFLRYAVRPGHVVHGGAGRLFKRFLEDARPESVVSYVDFNHTTAPQTFLNSLGFREEAPTGPAKVWHRLTDDKRVPQTSLLRLGADRLLGTSYGSREESGLDNDAIMVVEGFLPVFTAGNRRFVWQR